MTLDEIRTSLVGYRPGTFKGVEWARYITLKDGTQVIKHSKAVVRINIMYGHLESVKNREPKVEPISSIPTEWAIKNVVKINSKTGKNVIMLYTTKNKHQRTKTTWYDLNGNVINKQDIESLLYAKDNKVGSSDLDLFNININDLIAIEH